MTTGPAAPRIGRTIAESTPSFSHDPRPPAGAPNVVLVVLDDLGFAQLGCFGSDLETPTIDGLAADGLRFNRFHVTALCSPTRACLLTGRNHHAVGMGFLPDVPVGFPGYTGRIPPSAVTLPRILRDTGYSTFHVGKWHLTPRWEESASGPFTRWPLGLGYERFYGFLGGDTNQWTPELVSDNGFVEPPRSPHDGYHVTEDLVDHAIRFVQDQQHATPNRPFFLSFATGAMHAPHQVAPEWTARYTGRFDDGWEAWRARTFARQLATGVVPDGTKCPPRPEWVSAWDSLPADVRSLFARQMEVFAGFLTHTDAQLGRLFAFLSAIGALDNTLVMLCSDNGTSAEGGPHGSLNEHRFTHDLVDDLPTLVSQRDLLGGFRAYNHYSWGWAWAGNTPMKLWKRYTWLGGVRTPLIVRWPGGVDSSSNGEVRSQFCHAVDVMPTVLDAVGVEMPATVDGVKQQPIAGRSLRATFTLDGADVSPPRRTQYFEMLGSRAIYHDGWKATTDHIGNQLSIERRLVAGSHEFDADHWSLYDLRNDFSESHDLAATEPRRVRDLVSRWWSEAARNQVLPLDDSLIGRVTALEPRPDGVYARAVYRPGGGPVNEDSLPPMGAGFTIDAVLDVDTGIGARGVIAALGDWNNGYALYLDDGIPVFACSLFGDLVEARADRTVNEGRHLVTVSYARTRDDGRVLTIEVDGDAAASTTLPRDLPFRWQIGGAGLLVGRDHGFPVSDAYEPPFPCTARIDTVTITSTVLSAPDDRAAWLAAVLHRE